MKTLSDDNLHLDPPEPDEDEDEDGGDDLALLVERYENAIKRARRHLDNGDGNKALDAVREAATLLTAGLDDYVLTKEN